MNSEVFNTDRWQASSSPGYLLEIARSAMACQFQILLHPGHPPNGPELAYQALDTISYLEEQWSVYKPTSELSMLNQRAADGPIPISTSTKQLIALALEVNRRTEGAFDATSHKLSQAWGFYRREGKMPTEKEIDQALSSMGSQYIALNRSQNTIYFTRPVEINPGGIGKGLAIDMACQNFDSQTIQSYAFHGGKSSIRCRGSQTPPNETCRTKSNAQSDTNGNASAPDDDSKLQKSELQKDAPNTSPLVSQPNVSENQSLQPTATQLSGWQVSVRHPEQSERVLGTLDLRNQALGTSGPANQFFYFKGKRFGHIIDPRTGWPAEGMLSVTVMHPDAGWADALATGLYVMGIEKAISYCEANPDTAMLAILPGQRAGQVEIVTCNVSDDQWLPS